MATMKVTHSRDRRDRRAMPIEVGGQVVFRVREGEPEDRSLLRDFADCAKVPDLILKANAAGRGGVSVELEVVGTPEEPVPG